MGMFFSSAVASADQTSTAIYPDGSQWVKDNTRGWIMLVPPKAGRNAALPAPDKLNTTKHADVISGISTKDTDPVVLKNAQNAFDAKKPNGPVANANRAAKNATTAATLAAANAYNAANNASPAANANVSPNASAAVTASNESAVAAANATKAANAVTEAIAANTSLDEIRAATANANAAAAAANAAAANANKAANANAPPPAFGGRKTRNNRRTRRH